jgi:hypothetical protein
MAKVSAMEGSRASAKNNSYAWEKGKREERSRMQFEEEELPVMLAWRGGEKEKGKEQVVPNWQHEDKDNITHKVSQGNIPLL